MRSHFQSLQAWRIDLIGCLIAACLVIPDDPPLAVIAFVPLFAVWMTIRYLIARRYRERG